MAEGQTGEGKTAETQALSTENAQIPIIFPSSGICFANATFPQGKAIYTFKFQFIVQFPFSDKKPDAFRHPVSLIPNWIT